MQEEPGIARGLKQANKGGGPGFARRQAADSNVRLHEGRDGALNAKGDPKEWRRHGT